MSSTAGVQKRSTNLERSPPSNIDLEPLVGVLIEQVPKTPTVIHNEDSSQSTVAANQTPDNEFSHEPSIEDAKNGQDDVSRDFSDGYSYPADIYVQMFRDTLLKLRHSKKETEYPKCVNMAEAYALEILKELGLPLYDDVDKTYYFDFYKFRTLLEKLEVHVISCPLNRGTEIRLEELEQILSFEEAWVKYFKEGLNENSNGMRPNRLFTINYGMLTAKSDAYSLAHNVLAFTVLFIAFGAEWRADCFVESMYGRAGFYDPAIDCRKRLEMLQHGNKKQGPLDFVKLLEESVSGEKGAHYLVKDNQRLLKINLIDIADEKSIDSESVLESSENLTLVCLNEYTLDNDCRWDALVLLNTESSRPKHGKSWDDNWKMADLEETEKRASLQPNYTKCQNLVLSFRRALNNKDNASESGEREINKGGAGENGKIQMDLPWVIRSLGKALVENRIQKVGALSKQLDEADSGNVNFLERLSGASLQISAHNKRMKLYAFLSKSPPWPTPLFSETDVDDIVGIYDTLLEQTNKLKAHVFNNVTIAETRLMKRFTILASIFVPLSFVASIFGMNVREIALREPSIWVFLTVSIPLTLFSLSLTSFWEHVKSIFAEFWERVKSIHD
ncbi:hypothetical protein RUND412_007790 [Rhizina undulata]